MGPIIAATWMVHLLGSAPRYARFINRLTSKSRTYGLNEYSMAVLLRWLHAADARGREVYRLPGLFGPKSHGDM